MDMDVPPPKQILSNHGRRNPGEPMALLEVAARRLAATRPTFDSGTSTPYLTPSCIATLVTAMEAVGIDPAVIHAYRKTGVLVSQGNEDLWSGDDLNRWAAALEGYRGGGARGRV